MCPDPVADSGCPGVVGMNLQGGATRASAKRGACAATSCWSAAADVPPAVDREHRRRAAPAAVDRSATICSGSNSIRPDGCAEPREARSQRSQIDAGGLFLEPRQRQPFGVIAEAVAVGPDRRTDPEVVRSRGVEPRRPGVPPGPCHAPATLCRCAPGHRRPGHRADQSWVPVRCSPGCRDTGQCQQHLAFVALVGGPTRTRAGNTGRHCAPTGMRTPRRSVCGPRVTRPAG